MGSTVDLRSAYQVVVGISDMAVSNNPDVTLSTFALGSCIGVVGFDPHNRVAGLIHIMLTEHGKHRHKDYSPCMFVDTGLPHMLGELTRCKAVPGRMVFAMLGGASVNSRMGKSFFTIGEDNVRLAKTFFQQQNLNLAYEDTGGFVNRTMHFSIGDARLSVKKPTGIEDILLN